MTQINEVINNWNDALGEGRHRQAFSLEFLTLKQPCEFSQLNYSFWVSTSYFLTLASVFKAKKVYQIRRREIHDLPVPARLFTKRVGKLRTCPRLHDKKRRDLRAYCQMLQFHWLKEKTRSVIDQ